MTFKANTVFANMIYTSLKAGRIMIYPNTDPAFVF